MFIQTEITPNQDSLKFKPGVPVMLNGSTAEFLSGNSEGRGGQRATQLNRALRWY